MPTIEASYKDLCGLIGKKLPFDELKEAMQFVKSEIESRAGDLLKIEVKDTNRPELWSAEGLARGIRSHYKKTSLFAPKIKKSGLKVYVSPGMKSIRPCTVCAIVKNLKINEHCLLQMIQLQEKICDTFGLKRKEVALGIYDYRKIKGPVHFKPYKPCELKFVPLEFKKELTLQKILQQHPKGREYGHLLAGFKKYPVFIDAAGQVLSMPPIINSDHTGRVSAATKDVFIECSGFDLKFLLPALNAIVAALAERGGTIESVDVIYGKKKMVTPDLNPKKILIDMNYVNSITGVEHSKTALRKLLAKAGFESRPKGNKIEVLYPAYRQDIMHPADIIEDVLVAEGYNNIVPEYPSIASFGKFLPINKFAEEIKNIMTGAGAQEILSYILTNKENLIKKMNLQMNVIELENPVSKNWNVFRTWIVPSLMEFLSKNTHREYPQAIFEAGEVVLFDEKAETKSRNPVRLAWALSGKEADFTHAKQALDFLMGSLGLAYDISETEHASFIPGRAGRVSVKGVDVAYIGEIHPLVLSNWGLKMPVAAFEINLTELLKLI